MKRYLRSFTVILMVLLLLAGCGEKKQEETLDMAFIQINTDGIGLVATAGEGEGDPKFDAESPISAVGMQVSKGTKLTIACRPREDGWAFVKWLKNGNDFSLEPQIQITVEEDCEYTAVFALASDYAGEAVSDIKDAKTLGDILGLPYHQSGYDDTHYVRVFELGGVIYRAVADLPEDVKNALWDLDITDPEYPVKELDLVAPLEIVQLDNISEHIPSAEALEVYVGKTGAELLEDGWILEGYDLEELNFTMAKGMFDYLVRFDGEVDPENFDEEKDMAKLAVESVDYNGVYNCTDLSIPLE